MEKSDLNFCFIGWNTRDNHDKIWGYFTYQKKVDDRVYSNDDGTTAFIFWGKRVGSPSFKVDKISRDLRKLKIAKVDKGYRSISLAEFEKISPTAIEQLYTKLSWVLLSGGHR